MKKVKYEWEGVAFGKTYKTDSEIEKDFGWLIKRYKGIKIKEIRSIKDYGPTTGELYKA